MKSLKARIASLVMVLCLLLSLVPTTAFAAGGETNLAMTVDKTTANLGDTITVTVTNGAMTVNSFACKLAFDKDALTCTGIAGPMDGYADMFGLTKSGVPDMMAWAPATSSPTVSAANTNGAFGIAIASAASVSYKAGTIMTATFTATKAGAVDFVLYENSDGTDGINTETNTDKAITKSVTITKAPLTSASVSLGDPVKGQTLGSASTTASAYTVTSTEWYKGETASGSTVSGEAAANQVYTAKVTLTAKDGESFADTVSADGWEFVSSNGTTAVFTKTFNKTADKDPTTVTWKSNDPIEKTYNGSAQNAAESAADTVTVNGSNGKCSFRYYTNSGCTTLTSVAGSGAAAKGGAPKNAGTYWVKVEVAGNDFYTNGVTATAKKFVIAPKAFNAENITVSDINEQNYSTSQIKPNVTVTDKTLGALTLGTDYTVSYGENVKVGQGTVTVTGKGNYTNGTITKNFTIVKVDAPAGTVTAKGYSATYDGEAHGITVTAADATIKYGTTADTYDLTANPTYTNAGTYTVYYQVEMANYNTVTGSETVTISGKSLTSAMVTRDEGTFTYNGLEQKPTVTVKDGDKTLKLNTDYTVSYENNTNAGTTAKVTVTGKGNYTGEVVKTFTIGKAASSVTTAPAAKTLTYTGSAQALVTAGKATGGTMVYSLNGTNYGAEIPTGTDAGEYTVWYKVDGGDNYAGTKPASVTVSIGKADSSVTEAPEAKTLTYTGSAQALVTAGTPTGGDMVYSTAQNGTYEKTIPTGTDAGSYTVYYKVVGDKNHENTTPASVNVSIGKATVSGTVTGAKNVVVSASGPIELSSLTYSNLPGDFAAKSYELTAVVTGSKVVEDASVGESSVTLKSGLTAGDTQGLSVKLTSGNYNDITATVTLTVVNKEAATVNITGAPSSAKTYGDADFNLGVTCNPSGMPCTWSSSNTNVLTVNDGKVTIKGVGTATITATCEDDNYVGSNSVTITVNAKSVTITGLGAANKEYDGDATATVTGTAVLTGKVGGDDVTVSGGSAAFADKNVGTGKNVTFSDYSLSGKDAGNYILSAQPVSVKANITAKTLTVSGVTPSADVTKVYDGGTTVDQTFTLGLTGVVEGETVNAKYTSAAYNNKTVGNSKTVTLSGITLDGATAGNYTVAKTATTTGAITAKSVTITGLSAADKVYDGKTNATVTGTAVVTDKVSGDTVTVSGGSAAFADKNVGTGKNVTFSGYSLSGKDAGNYTLSAQPATVTANITAKTLTITGVSATSRSYVEDNTAVDLTGGSLVGVVSGDTVNFTLGSGSIESANAGNRKAVTTNITLTGADKDNYTLTQPTVTVTISKAAAPAAPSVTGVNCTTSAQNNGKITGVNSKMEYKLSTASAWTKVTGTEITDLVPGTYQVRVAGNDNVEAGAVKTVTIAAHECEFTNYAYNNDATCAKNGTETAHCTGEGCKATNTREKAGTMTAHEYVNGVCKNCQAVNPVGTTLSKKTVTSVEKVTALVSAGKIAVEEGKSEALVQAIRDDKLTTKNKVKTISTPANATAFVNKANEVVSRDSSMKNADVVAYLDVSVVLVANGTELGNITETDRPVTFQIKLDEQLAASLAGKKVFVLREHGSEITKLAATLSAGILTFSSDKFSTYAIVAYEPVSGGNHHGGSYNPGHTVTSDLGNVTRVTVDGKVVDSKYYTVSGGNVVLSGEFMKTLTNGKHTVKLYNGSIAATGVITVTGNTVQAPRTGDAGAVLYGVMAISSVLGMGWVAKKKRCEK